MFVYFVLLQRHLPPDTPIRELLHKPDYSGMAFYCLSAVLIYAGLDQGERLGWFDSGIITVFLAGGIVSFLLFLANEADARRDNSPGSGAISSSKSLLYICQQNYKKAKGEGNPSPFLFTVYSVSFSRSASTAASLPRLIS